MRPLGFARIVLRAELLYLRRVARRHAGRLLVGLVAAGFLVACLALLHAAAVLALIRLMSPLLAILCVAGADLLIGALLAALALRDRPGALERETLAVRDTAARELARAAAFGALAARLTALLRRRDRRAGG